jgi:hypothetical protein
MRVYVVAGPTYDDWTVYGVYSHEEDALRRCKKECLSPSGCIYEFTIDDKPDEVENESTNP